MFRFFRNLSTVSRVFHLHSLFHTFSSLLHSSFHQLIIPSLQQFSFLCLPCSFSHVFFSQEEHAMRWVGTCYEVGRNILYCQLIIQVQTFFRKTIGLIWLLRNIRICQTYQITTHCRLKVIIYKVPTTILLQT